MRPFAVFSSVGTRSKHGRWLSSGSNRRFDLWLCDYRDRHLSTTDFSSHVERYWRRQGSKFSNLAALLEEEPNALSHYDFVMLLDDDIEIEGSQLDALFEICAQHRLDLAQPAFSADSVISHEFTGVRAGGGVRPVPFVEVGVPVFSRDAFARCAPIFGETVSGFAQDLVWPRCLGADARIAVVDSVVCRHPRRAADDDSGIDSLIPREEHRREARPLLERYRIDLDRALGRSPTFKDRLMRWLSRASSR